MNAMCAWLNSSIVPACAAGCSSRSPGRSSMPVTVRVTDCASCTGGNPPLATTSICIRRVQLEHDAVADADVEQVGEPPVDRDLVAARRRGARARRAGGTGGSGCPTRRRAAPPAPSVRCRRGDGLRPAPATRRSRSAASRPPPVHRAAAAVCSTSADTGGSNANENTTRSAGREKSMNRSIEVSARRPASTAARVRPRTRPTASVRTICRARLGRRTARDDAGRDRREDQAATGTEPATVAPAPGADVHSHVAADGAQPVAHVHEAVARGGDGRRRSPARRRRPSNRSRGDSPSSHTLTATWASGACLAAFCSASRQQK